MIEPFLYQVLLCEDAVLNVTDCPAHNVVEPATLIHACGKGFTVTVTFADAEQPAALVTVTV